MRIDVNTKRAVAGEARDIIDEVIDRYSAGEDLETAWNATLEAAADRAAQRFEPKIRAAFGRAGIDLPEGALTIEGIKSAIAERAGLDAGEELTIESISRAVDNTVSSKISQALGVEVPSIMDAGGVQEALRAAVKQAIASGQAARLIGRALNVSIRKIATWRAAQIAEEDHKRIMSALYQKRYRRTHRLVWDK